jgi:CRP-like cAMP-binding protein/tetratricopeptide (TPR) repeat protein
MSSEKLRKYLAYYQKVLRDEPKNIEARLRLAALFREMGRTSHAIEEYVTASKLLAKEGLPLEAIAACKAVLELDPQHLEVKYFLARLFAQVPEAGGGGRVAQPVGAPDELAPTRETRPLSSRREEVITLDTPKDDAEATQRADVVADAWTPHEKEGATREADLHDVVGESLRDTVEETRQTDSVDTRPLLDRREDQQTVEMDPVERNQEFYETVDVDAADILAEYRDQGESFEVGIFDFDSLGLDEATDDLDLDALGVPESEVDDALDDTANISSSVVEVRRSDLPKIPLFSDLDADAFVELLEVIDVVSASRGEVILAPTDRHPVLYVIVKGEAKVLREVDGSDVEIARMEVGDFFGEFRLLTGRDVHARVVADSQMDLLALSKDVIHDLGSKHPAIWDVLWDFYYARMLNNLLAASTMFRPLDGEARRRLADAFQLREVVAGDTFLKQGELCTHLFLVLSGEVVVERHADGLTQQLATFREGEFFGVASSLGNEPYTADCTAMRDTMLHCLPAEVFQEVADSTPAVMREVQRVMHKRRALNNAFVSGVTLYAELGVTKEFRDER